MKKRICAGALCVAAMLVLVGCQQAQELPPSPPAPGGQGIVGRAFGGIPIAEGELPSWASPLKYTDVTPATVEPGETVVITVERPAAIPSDRDFWVYGTTYVLDQVTGAWLPEDLIAAESGEIVQNWAKEKAVFSFEADSQVFPAGLNYFLAYACVWTGEHDAQNNKVWDCNNFQWMLGAFEVEEPAAVCGDGVVEGDEQCEGTADCSGPLVCAGDCRCVECETDAHCESLYGPALPICVESLNACRPACSDDDDCQGDNVCYEGACLAPGEVPEEEVCGDGVCDAGEDETTCPEDCPEEEEPTVSGMSFMVCGTSDPGDAADVPFTADAACDAGNDVGVETADCDGGGGGPTGSAVYWDGERVDTPYYAPPPAYTGAAIGGAVPRAVVTSGVQVTVVVIAAVGILAVTLLNFVFRENDE